jgi:hypothetical protein
MKPETIIRRTIHPTVRVIDAKEGMVEYVASDETLDSYREIIRAGGWRFSMFEKNAPFVDSHDYYSIDKLLGRVVDFRVEKRQLIETVKWAKDVEENTLAKLGWKMTEAGYLKAVSVGFWPTKSVGPSDGTRWTEQLTDLKIDPDKASVRRVYLEQEQVELSACIIGANPNALAKSYKAGALTDDDLEFLSKQISAKNQPETKPDAASHDPAPDATASAARAQTAFLVELYSAISKM